MTAVLVPLGLACPVGAQSLGAGAEFSILDYLEAGSIENTPDQWIAEAEAATTPDEALIAYGHALKGVLRKNAIEPVAAHTITHLRYAVLAAALKVAVATEGEDRTRALDSAREQARDMADKVDSGWAYWAIARAETDMGRGERARILLRRAALESRQAAESTGRNLLLKAIADLSIAAGDIDFAAFQLRNMATPEGRDLLARNVASAKVASDATPDDLRAALMRVLESEALQATLKTEIADLLEAGQPYEALEIAFVQGDLSEQGDLLTMISKYGIKSNEFSLSLLAARMNPDDGEASRSWLRLAAEYRKRAYIAQSDEALTNALTRATGPGGDATDIARVAMAHMDNGNLDRAGQLLEPLENDEKIVVEAKARLIAKQVAADDTGALSGLGDLPMTEVQNDEILAQSAIAAARSRNMADALETLSKVRAPAVSDPAALKIMKVLLDLDNDTLADRLINEIKNPAIRLEADALYAKWLVLNDDVIVGRRRFEGFAQTLVEFDTKTADRSARKIAKITADAGRHDQALDLAMGIIDDKLRQETITNVGRVIAQDDPERALQLVDRLKDSKYRDKLYGEVALGFVDQGEIIRASDIAQKIIADKTRVKYMRKIAEKQALRLDRYNILEPSAPMPEGRKFAVEDLVPGPSYGTAKLFEIEIDPLRPLVPPPPHDRLWTSGDEVRADIRPIKPGRAAVALMRSSYFNEKFLSKIPGQTLLRNKQARNSLEFVMVETGVFDVPALYRQLRAQGHGDDVILKEGRTYTLRRPLLVMPDATLVISGTDVDSLRLSETAGSFVVVAGNIQIADTIFESWDEVAGERAYRVYAQKKKFRPFLTIWTGGTIDAVGTTFFGLGYLSGKSYGLAMSAGPATTRKNRPMYEDGPTGRIIDNSFRNMFYAYYAYEAIDVDIIGNELVDNIVYGLDPHDRAQRLMMAFNTGYDTHEKHGLIVSREVDFSWMIGNISYRNKGSGYMLDRDSIESLLYANTGFENVQDGISFFESSCNIIAGNLMFNNQRDGIKIRNSWNVGVIGNEIRGNGASGIDVYTRWLDPTGAHVTRDFDLDPYFSFSAVEIHANDMARNRAGIKFEGVNSALIGENNMGDQSPRLFAGDLKSIGGSLIGTLARERTVGIAHQCAQVVPDMPCSLVRDGYLSGDGQGMMSMLNDTGRCIPLVAQPRFDVVDAGAQDEALADPQEIETELTEPAPAEGAQ